MPITTRLGSLRNAAHNHLSQVGFKLRHRVLPKITFPEKQYKDIHNTLQKNQSYWLEPHASITFQPAKSPEEILRHITPQLNRNNKYWLTRVLENKPVIQHPHAPNDFDRSLENFQGSAHSLQADDANLSNYARSIQNRIELQKIYDRKANTLWGLGAYGLGTTTVLGTGLAVKSAFDSSTNRSD